jgi:hypothetical protein
MMILRSLAILQTHCILYLKWNNILRFVCTSKKISIITKKSISRTALIPADEPVHLKKGFQLLSPTLLKAGNIERVTIP